MPAKISMKREGNSGGLLPDGIYRLKIEAADEKNGPSGHPYLNMRYRVLVNGQASSTAVWDILSLSPQARFKVDQFLDSLNAPEEGDVSPQFFVNKFVWATIKTGQYQGNYRNEVGQYLTDDVAQKQIAENGDNASVLGVSNSAVESAPSRPANGSHPAPASARPGKAKAAVQANRVAEMEEDDFPM